MTLMLKHEERDYLRSVLSDLIFCFVFALNRVFLLT